MMEKLRQAWHSQAVRLQLLEGRGSGGWGHGGPCSPAGGTCPEQRCGLGKEKLLAGGAIPPEGLGSCCSS